MEPTHEPPPIAASSRRPGAPLRAAAVAILVAGLLAAAGVWVTADDDVPGGDGTSYRIVGGQVDAEADAAERDRQSERLGGEALVRTAAFDRWLGSLWHGRRLAWTLGALAVVLAAACAWIAALMDAPVDD